MIKGWKIQSYGALVRLEIYDLEKVEDSEKVSVEERDPEYIPYVAEYLVTNKIPQI